MSRLEAYIPVVQIFSARVALFHTRIAAALDLNPTDLLCLRLLSNGVAATASDLAAQTGMSLPAMTAVVDRLSARRLLRRDRDDDDRRRVRLTVAPQAKRRLDDLYRRQGAAMTGLLARYDAAEFALILQFLEDTGAVLGEALARPPASRRRPSPAPRRAG